MAKGRMVNTSICMNKCINELTSDTSRLAFTWLIPFADREGRTHGDPALLCSMLFPRRKDVTFEMMHGFIQEWADAGLIVWYEAHDDLWIELPGFAKNQPGLRKEREPESTIPAPAEGRIIGGPSEEQIRHNDGTMPDDCRQNDGMMTENIPQNGMELNGTKQNETEVAAAAECRRPAGADAPGGAADSVSLVFQRWMDINPRRQITPIDVDTLNDMIADYGAPEVAEAIVKANSQGKPYLAYVEGILKRIRDGTPRPVPRAVQKPAVVIPERWS